MARVSVIIPTFNRADKVVRAVCSVLDQTFNDFELIVVDDGSTDSTERRLEPFVDRIKYISHPSNLGVSAARNTAIENSSAPFIAFLDSDDYWMPEKLEVQVTFFKTHTDARICQTEEIWIRNGRRVNPRKKHRKPSGDIFEPSLKLCLVSPSAVMLKRSLLDAVGLFDESLPACEDYDLWLRIACQHPVYLIPEPLIFKEGGHSDQLSSRHTGMDRFRITAILKLIRSGRLNEKQFTAASKELALKCRIYGNGCMKRGKKEEGAYYLQLSESIKNKEPEMERDVPGDNPDYAF